MVGLDACTRAPVAPRASRPRDVGPTVVTACGVTARARPAAGGGFGPVAAWFRLGGRQCVVVPSQAAPNHERVLGRLSLDGREYVVLSVAVTPAADALDALSPRELEIALLVAEGWDAKNIAHRLRISFHTVRVHVGRIYCKLGLHKQTELVACVAAHFGGVPRPAVGTAARGSLRHEPHEG